MPQTSTAARPRVQTAAAVVGAVFLAVGVAGFVPGLTTGLDGLRFAGHHSEALVFGLFAVSVLHNIVHLLFGAIGIAGSRTVRGATLFLVGGGVVYLVLWLYGLVVGHDSAANFLPVNDADNWLHLLLGLGMCALGLGLVKRVKRVRRPKA